MSYKNIKKIKNRKKIEECAEFFLNNKETNTYKKLNNPNNKEYYFTLKDNLTEIIKITNNNNSKNLLSEINDINDKKNILDNKNTSKKNKNSNLLLNNSKMTKNNDNDNCNKDDFEYIPFSNNLSLQIEKNLQKEKDGEIKTRIDEFKQLSKKFIMPFDTFAGKQEKNFNHHLTNSQFEIMETDEKLPQIIINQIKTERNEIKSNDNENDNDNNIIYPFYFFIEKEKCYQKISKDLKGNGNTNIEYKIKVAAKYINILLIPKYSICDFIINIKEMNKFLIIDLCLFLLILFLDEFTKELKENDISDFLTCLGYCHLNFLFILLIFVNKTNEEKFKYTQNLSWENFNSYISYQKCKTLIELNSGKVDEMKFELNFHGQNKIIKNILIHLLTKLSLINPTVCENILKILNYSKNYTLKQVIDEHISNNNLILEKMVKIKSEILSPENIPNNYDINLDKNLDYNNNEDIDLSYEDEYLAPLVPFLPQKSLEDKRDYCLVLDLDETLVHYYEEENDAYVKIRNGTEKFIQILSEFCEIIIFTSSKKHYADSVINGLDVKNFIDFRLYRHHTSPYKGYYIKDLSKLGRPINKIIIIDNIEENYQLQMDNGLNIINYEGEENDNELEYLLNDLLPIVKEPGKDVYKGLIKVRRSMQKRYSNFDFCI